MGGDDGEFVCGLGSFDYKAADEAGDKAVKDAKTNGLVIIYKSAALIGRCIHEEGNYSHQGVYTECDPEKIESGRSSAYVFGDYIGAAGGGVIFHADAVNKSADNTAEQHREDGIVSLCVVLELGEPYSLQIEINEGIAKAENKTALCESFVQKKICENTKRDVDNKRYITDGKAGLVLYHGSDTVKSCGREAVFNDEKLIIKGEKNGNADNESVSRKVFVKGFSRTFSHFEKLLLI